MPKLDVSDAEVDALVAYLLRRQHEGTRTKGSTTSTQLIARRAQAGDADAYGDLVARHRPAALRVATVVLGRAEGADDVVQQATERAWRAIATFDVARPFRPWFLRIVANGARNDRRAGGRRAHLEVRVASADAARRS